MTELDTQIEASERNLKFYRDSIKELEEKAENERRIFEALRNKKQQERTKACREHHYLPYGRYAGGVRCQFCGDEIGTTW